MLAACLIASKSRSEPSQIGQTYWIRLLAFFFCLVDNLSAKTKRIISKEKYTLIKSRAISLGKNVGINAGNNHQYWNKQKHKP